MSEARKIELEEEEEELQEVAVLDDASAEMLLNRIKWANEQYERMEAWYAHQLEKAREVRDRTVQWAEHGLRAYFDMVPVKKTKTQVSYELPGGKLILKAQQPKFDVKDEVLVPWLKQNGLKDLVKVEESANWAELKKTVKIAGDAVTNEDGEIIPGITVTPRDPKFVVTVK